MNFQEHADAARRRKPAGHQIDDLYSQVERLRKRVLDLECEVVELQSWPKLRKRREMQAQINQLTFLVKTLMEGK